MWQLENEFSVLLGGNLYINTPNLITYNGKPIFIIRRGDDGMLGVDFEAYSSNGEKIATFRKGVVVHGDTDKYDIISGHSEYVVTEKESGRSIASVKRRGTSAAELEVSVTMHLPDGFLLIANPSHTNIGGSVLTGNTFKNCAAGIAIAR